MNQAMSEEERQERQEARTLMERKAAQQNKNTSEELKQGLRRHRLRLTKLGRNAELFLATESGPLHPTYIKAKESFHLQC